MSTPVLYNYDLDDACYTVRLVASCLGIKLVTRSIDMFPGKEHLSPAMLALNPQGRLPVLEDGDLVLTHVSAIVTYLAEVHAPDTALMPSDGPTRARMNDFIAFATRDLVAASGARATAMLDAPGDLELLRSTAKTGLRLLDDHMIRQGILDQGYLAGDKATLADLVCFPAFALSRDFWIDHDEFPALRLWARRVRGIEGFVTMPGIPDYH